MSTRILPLLTGGDCCYLLESDGGHTALIDTGRASTRERLMNALGTRRIGLVLLTHGHFDHVYNAAFLAKEYGAKIAIAEEDLARARDNRIRTIHSRGLIGYFIRKVSVATIGRARIEPFEPSFFLRDGMSLEEYGFDAKIIALPGHTEGSVGILCGDACVVGDALMSMGGVSAARIAQNFEQADRSVAMLKELDAKIYYPGHGRAISRNELCRIKV